MASEQKQFHKLGSACYDGDLAAIAKLLKAGVRADAFPHNVRHPKKTTKEIKAWLASTGCEARTESGQEADVEVHGGGVAEIVAEAVAEAAQGEDDGHQEIPIAKVILQRLSSGLRVVQRAREQPQ